MSSTKPSERTVFLEALDHVAGASREAYVNEACRDDAQLRDRVVSLLEAHESSQSELAGFGFDAAEKGFQDVAPSQGLMESVGDTVGRYKLVEQIGEGGFALVFRAEQQHPVHRQVAVKLIKPGMDTRQVIARFDAERQALAMMDHSNIAKVFDAGTTESGRPYFVMELVRGVPITDYCDACQLATRERLTLLIAVCQAVQHAHQKGVIHRDIKPSNVLVAIQDKIPTPKIIDFGVAKAINRQLTEYTLETGFAQIVGTPLYMSPEQAELSPLGVDTRCDIYSLGVLLYELLTGTTPFDKERLRKAPYDELRRIIREEEPPKPSARISTLAENLASTIADHRRTTTRRLSQTVQGELDWIVMNCVEKDRDRRYETANGLARDIERYLRDEPVLACPPSAAYRFRKFARRNKGVFYAATAIVAMLLLLVVGLAISNRLIAAERNEKALALAEKEQALTRAEAERRRAEVERRRAEDNFRRARIAVRGILSDAARGVGEWSELSPSLREKFAQETVNYYESLLQEESADPSLQYETAVGYRSLSAIFNSLGQREQAERFLRKSIAVLQQLTEQSQAMRYRHQLAYTLYMHGWRLDMAGRSAEAEDALQRSADLYEMLVSDQPDHGSYYLELAACYRVLIRLQDTRGEVRNARRSAGRLGALLQKAVSASPNISDLEMVWRLELLPKAPPAAPTTPDVPIGIAEAMVNVDRVNVAVTACRKIMRAAPESTAAHYCLAYVLEVSGQFEEAIAQLQKAIDLEPDYVDAHNGLAWLLATCPDEDLVDAGRAVVHALRAVELAPMHAAFWNVLGIAHYRSRSFDAARQSLDKALELQGDDAYVRFFLAMSDWQLGNAAAARDSYQKAVVWMESERPHDQQLLALRREAAEMLGVDDASSSDAED